MSYSWAKTQGQLGVYEDHADRPLPFFDAISITHAWYDVENNEIMLSVGHSYGCGEHYYGWDILDQDKERSILKLELLHETNNTCEAGVFKDIVLALPAIDFRPNVILISVQGEEIMSVDVVH